MCEEEVWKSIDWFTGDESILNGLYKISSFGRVLSCRSNSILRFSDARGYRLVILQKSPIKKAIKVHRLVALAFLPRVPGKDIVNHIDGNKQNNHSENLEWCTLSENTQHSLSLGLQTPLQGTEVGSSKLTEAEVTEIFMDISTPALELARKYNIELSNIQNILNGTSYRNITELLDRPERDAPRRKRTCLSDGEAIQILGSTKTYTELALEYGVGRTTIGRIKRKEGKWRFLE